MPEHTPGEWKVRRLSKFTGWVVDSPYGPVAYTATAVPAIPGSQEEGNAHLLGAASALLAACKGLVRVAVEDMPELAHSMINWREAVEAGIAAISRVEGEEEKDVTDS